MLAVAAREALELKVAKAHELARRQSARSLAAYLDHVVIDSTPPRRWSLIREPWQTELVAPLVPAIEHACGLRPDYDGPLFFWFTLPKGHDKSSLIGRLLNWAIGFARNPIKAYAAAADKTQARIVRDAMKAEARRNLWLTERLRFNNWEVTGLGGKLEIRSSDADTASGLIPDFVVCDEVTFWKSRDLYDVLFGGAGKRPHCVFIVITNAGLKGPDQWQWLLREIARTSPAWHFHESPEGVRLASWMSEAKVAEIRKGLTPSMARRVLDNVWVDPAETEAQYLTRDQLTACTDPALTERTRGDRGKTYVLAGDLGITKDRATMAVAHRDGDRVVLDTLKVWAAPPGGRIDFDAVQAWAEQAVKDFRLRHAIFDNNQAEFLTQRLEKLGLAVTRYSFQGWGHTHLADNLRTLVQDRKIAWYPDAGRLTLPDGTAEDLITELARLVTVEQSASGMYRVDHGPGQHDDRYTSLALAAYAVVKLPARRSPQVIALTAAPTPKPADTSTGNYVGIKYLPSLESWHAVPEIDGETVSLSDYPTRDEAAHAVNAAHQLLGRPAPNTVPPDKLSDETRGRITAGVERSLRDRRILERFRGWCSGVAAVAEVVPALVWGEQIHGLPQE